MNISSFYRNTLQRCYMVEDMVFVLVLRLSFLLILVLLVNAKSITKSRFIEDEGDYPSYLYQHLRNRILNTLNHFTKSLQVLSSRHFRLALDQVRLIKADLSQLSDFDGFDGWRTQEAQDLSISIQKRFSDQQSNCLYTLTCDFMSSDKMKVGFGTFLTRIQLAFFAAFTSNRSLVYHTKGWNYNPSGWKSIFYPISMCSNLTSVIHLSDACTADKHAFLNLDDLTKPKISVRSIPKELGKRLQKLHGNPIVWWIGQITKFLLRFSQKLETIFQNYAKNIDFQQPIVGIHIRRTDKNTEVPNSDLHQYMMHVKEFYYQLNMIQSINIRRVYVASDSVDVIQRFKALYSSDFKIISNPKIAKIANPRDRYSSESLLGLILDIHFLSRSDYLVCTFSSNVGRTAYELMQTYRTDASLKAISLDHVWEIGYTEPLWSTVQIPHYKTGIRYKGVMDRELLVGDQILIDGHKSNQFNGLSFGWLTKNNVSEWIWFPTFIIKDNIVYLK